MERNSIADLSRNLPPSLRMALSRPGLLPPKVQAQLAAAMEPAAQPQTARAPAEIPPLAEWIANSVTIEDPQREPSIIPFDLWPAQRDLINDLLSERRLIILKARQLGITWLVIAYVIWLCLYHDSKTVIIISKDGDAAREVIKRARGVYNRLADKPHALTISNTEEIAFTNGSRLKAFASSSDAGSSFTASLLILDEFAKNPRADDIYTAAKPTIDDNGAVIVLSTAKGEDNVFARLWHRAEGALGNLKAVFIAWHARPGRDAAWYERTSAEALSLAHHKQEYPSTPAEAFQRLSDNPFLPDFAYWQQCRETLPALDSSEPLVIGVDAAVSNDKFAIVAVAPHGERAAVRRVHVWSAPPGGAIDYSEPARVLNDLIDNYNVIQITYDPFQLVGPMQDIARGGRVYVSEFSQQSERLEADNKLRQDIITRRIAHDYSDEDTLSQHIKNADAEINEAGNRLRIVKRETSLKIDAAVALSMANYRLAGLNL